MDLWISEVKRNCREDTPILLVGNKVDTIQLYGTGKDFTPDEINLVNGYFKEILQEHNFIEKTTNTLGIKIKRSKREL